MPDLEVKLNLWTSSSLVFSAFRFVLQFPDQCADRPLTAHPYRHASMPCRFVSPKYSLGSEQSLSNTSSKLEFLSNFFVYFSSLSL